MRVSLPLFSIKSARSATRLFRIIQDVCNPSFNVDGRQWRSSVAKVFQIFFSLLWTDSEVYKYPWSFRRDSTHRKYQEEVRLLVKTHCSSLLPAHFEAITSCFDEMATRAPIFDRLKLTLFLAQLRTHIPRWQGMFSSPAAFLVFFFDHSPFDWGYSALMGFSTNSLEWQPWIRPSHLLRYWSSECV